MAHGSRANRTETKGIAILELVLSDTNLIESVFKQRDKEPIYDGYFMLLDGTNEENLIRKFAVQIKCESEPYYLANDEYALSHQMDCDFLRSVKNGFDLNPSFYFVIDTTKRRVFFKYVNKQFLSSIKDEDMEKDSITYHFTKDDVLDDASINTFISLLYQIHDELTDLSGEEIVNAKKAAHYLNAKLERYSFIKNALFPNLDSFGISSSLRNVEMKNKDGFIVGSGSGKIYSIYPRYLAINDKEIKIYNENDENYYTHFNLLPKNNPIDTVKGFLKTVVEKYLFTYCGVLELASDSVLDEVAFSILDEFSRVTGKYRKSDENYSFYKDSLSTLEYMTIFSEINSVFSPSPFRDNEIFCLNIRLASELRRRNKAQINRVRYFEDLKGVKYGYLPRYFLSEDSYLREADNILLSIPTELDYLLNNLDIRFKKQICGKHYYSIKKDFTMGFEFHSALISTNDLDKGKLTFEKADNPRNVKNITSIMSFDFDGTIKDKPLYNILIACCAKLFCDDLDIKPLSIGATKPDFLDIK